MGRPEEPSRRRGGLIPRSTISAESSSLASVAVEGYARSSSARSAGRNEARGAYAAAAKFKSLEWLEDGKHPLDWNGPAGRIFTRFRDEDLDRPIIEQLERVARLHRNLNAFTDSDTSLSFGELWDGLSGLAEAIAA